MNQIGVERLTCESHGEFDARVIEMPLGLLPHVERCPRCEEEQQKEREAREHTDQARNRALKVSDLKHRAGIPCRFADAGFTMPGGETAEIRKAIKAGQRFAEEFGAVYDEGRNLVLIGPPGTGKTHLAAAIARYVIENHLVEARYTTAAEMARTMRESFRKDSAVSEADVFNRIAFADLVVIDEIGTGSSQHDRDLLFALIDARYAEMLPMILVSNLPPVELEAYLGQRAFDRLVETSTFMPMTGASKRRGRAKHAGRTAEASP